MAIASGELLNMVQKSARSGTLLSSCEPEVNELMHQLDVLISEHQREWAEQMKKTKLQLQLREEELATLRISLHERTDQLERLRLQSLQQEQEHRARHADCEAQLVRVRSELSRLRHSYEQLRAKRSQQKATCTAVSIKHGATNYRQECYSLRQQLVEAKEMGRELEKHCGGLREQVKKGEERLKVLESERKQSQQGLAYLQETLETKDGMIRKLEDQASVARVSTGCQSELQQIQQELREHLQLEQELRESLRRAKEEGSVWRTELSKVKAEQYRQESEVIHKLEERVQNLEHQLMLNQLNTEKSHSAAIKQFTEQAEQLVQSTLNLEGQGYVALEPVQHQVSSEVEDDERWSKLLENVLGKHFDQLDCSLQNIILSPN